MKTSKKPKVYAVRVKNFAVTAANCIAAIALQRSADEFKNAYPV